MFLVWGINVTSQNFLVLAYVLLLPFLFVHVLLGSVVFVGLLLYGLCCDDCEDR